MNARNGTKENKWYDINHPPTIITPMIATTLATDTQTWKHLH